MIGLTACVGRIAAEPVADGGADAASLADGGPLATACAPTADPGPLPLRRLSRIEYDHTVHDLLGDTSAPATMFPADETTNGFSNDATTQDVSETLAQRYQAAAEQLSAQFVAHDAALFTTLGCQPSGTAATRCVRTLVQYLAPRAWRRPVTDDEVAQLMNLFSTTSSGGTVDEGIQAIVEALLQSPHFLYRVELGAPAAAGDRVVALTSYEMASRLSYFLWASMPDDALFAAAASDALTTPAQIEAQARRMLADPRARATIETFHAEWLGLGALDDLDPDPARYPLFTATTAASMRADTLAFADHVLFEGDGRLETLMTASVAFVDANTAPLYGVGAPASGTMQVSVDPTQRAGLLTTVGVLAANDQDDLAPIFRGKLLRLQFFCGSLGSPPANVPAPPTPRDGQSTRERLLQHRADPSCAGCHDQMDPIGFGFENFDALGQYRTLDNGVAVDSSATIAGAGDADGTFADAPSIAHHLATSDTVRACVATQWFRYAAGRNDTAADACSVTDATTAFAASGYDVRELIIALTRTHAFRYRRAVSAEGT